MPNSLYDNDASCPLKQLLTLLDDCLSHWDSSEVTFVIQVHQVLLSCACRHSPSRVGYSLFPQWELFKTSFVRTISIFDATTLKPLVLSCLSFFLAVADEHVVLCMEVEKLQTLLLRLFDRIRIPNINSNDNNNIDEVCANRELISHALRLLQVCTYILLYNSSNNHKLGLILRNCLVRAWCGRDV